MSNSNYDKSPFVAVSDLVHECRLGWEAIADELKLALTRSRSAKRILVVECYPGVEEQTILRELESRLSPALTIHAAEALLPSAKINALVAPFLGGDEPTLDFPSRLSLVNFFSAEPLWRFRRIIDEWKSGLILIVGCGASLIAWGHLLVYADLTRHQAKLCFHRHEAANLGAQNHTAAARQQSKRACLLDWRVANRWKRPLIKHWDFVLDTNHVEEPKLAHGEDVRRGLGEAARRPFRLMPLLDSTPWGGQGLKELSDINGGEVNSGRSLDGVPEENNLVLGLGQTLFELPAMDLVYHQPEALLGHSVSVSFGGEFPIHLDFLDTMGGADSSVQVHPLPSFIQRKPGPHCKQAEIYFIETRRHSFRKAIPHETHDSVNILKLVEGGEVIVESPAGAFAPFIVHDAETFIVPAAVKEYTIRPYGPSLGHPCVTIKAFVRT